MEVLVAGSSGRMSGPAPKDPSKRARRNKDHIGQTVLAFIPGEQPKLPTLYDTDSEGMDVEVRWHPQTRVWWDMWRDAAQSDTLTATDWSFLLDTALIHHRFWEGDMKAAPELRLRVAKFGATPEDRARLRMVFAEADEKEERRTREGGSSQPVPGSAYGGLRAVPDARRS